MNKKGILAEKTGYVIVWTILFAFAALYFFNILGMSSSVAFNTESIEDSIVATRVLNCFSDDNYFFDADKMTNVEFRDCFSNAKYILEIELDKKESENKIFEPSGNVGGITREVRRYVKLKNGEEGILKITYRKKS